MDYDEIIQNLDDYLLSEIEDKCNTSVSAKELILTYQIKNPELSFDPSFIAKKGFKDRINSQGAKLEKIIRNETSISFHFVFM